MSGAASDEEPRPDWVFGYGSLVWRPAFAAAETVPGLIHGWRRRFWQGSTDHRGVPGAPGRVVTLERAEDELCWGMAYRLEPERAESIHDALDVREQGGYELLVEDCRLRDGRTVRSAVYVATPDNPNYLGEAPVEQLVEEVLSSKGPSGDNVEYVVELADALRSLGVEDPHVFELAEAVRRRL